MSKRWDAIRGSAGFYITMAVCLLVIAVSSYYLLTEDKPASASPAAENAVPARDAYVPASAPESVREEEPSDSPVVETVSPAPMEVPVREMPEIDVTLDDTPVVAEAPLQVVAPLDGEVITAFAMDQLVYNATLQDWRTHDGVDISAEAGTPVLAACAGSVLSVTEDALMGTTVVLEHEGGCRSVYSNLRAGPDVEAGQSVAAGQIIGAVGTTAAAESAQGPHLHFSVSRDGESVDPQEFLK